MSELGFSKEDLAKKFVDLLMEELSAANFVQVLYRNALPLYDNSCASHDFCDANMVMLAAWRDLGYGEMDPSSPADAGLWNDAWDIAKKNFLTITKAA